MTKTGEVVEIHCTYDPQTRNAPPADGRKVPGVIHWVSAGHCVPAEVRLYDRLFSIEDPGSEEDFIKYLNPNSLEIRDDLLCRAKSEKRRTGEPISV